MSRKVPPVDTSTEAWSKFVQSTGAIFSNWTVLSLACDNAWGGMRSQGKAQHMMQNALSLFAQGGQPVYADELSDFFEDTVLDAFSCDAEDGSCREVAEKIVRQFRLCVHEGNFSEADEMIGAAGAAAGRALALSKEAPTTVDTALPALSGGCPADPGLGGGAGALEKPPTTGVGLTGVGGGKSPVDTFSGNNFWAKPTGGFEDDPVLKQLSGQAPAAASSGAAPMDLGTVPRGGSSQGGRAKSPQRPQVDDDGFEMVTRKGRRRGR
jgi:hypothetical protein